MLQSMGSQRVGLREVSTISSLVDMLLGIMAINGLKSWMLMLSLSSKKMESLTKQLRIASVEISSKKVVLNIQWCFTKTLEVKNLKLMPCCAEMV